MLVLEGLTTIFKHTHVWTDSSEAGSRQMPSYSRWVSSVGCGKGYALYYSLPLHMSLSLDDECCVFSVGSADVISDIEKPRE